MDPPLRLKGTPEKECEQPSVAERPSADRQQGSTCKELNPAKNKNKLKRRTQSYRQARSDLFLDFSIVRLGAKDPVIPSGDSYLQIHEIIHGRCSSPGVLGSRRKRMQLHSPRLQKRKLTLREVHWLKPPGEGCVGRI